MKTGLKKKGAGDGSLDEILKYLDQRGVSRMTWRYAELAIDLDPPSSEG